MIPPRCIQTNAAFSLSTSCLFPQGAFKYEYVLSHGSQEFTTGKELMYKNPKLHNFLMENTFYWNLNSRTL